MCYSAVVRSAASSLASWVRVGGVHWSSRNRSVREIMLSHLSHAVFFIKPLYTQWIRICRVIYLAAVGAWVGLWFENYQEVNFDSFWQETNSRRTCCDAHESCSAHARAVCGLFSTHFTWPKDALRREHHSWVPQADGTYVRCGGAWA